MEVRMEGSKLYIGNLSYAVTSEQLKELFSTCGEVGEIRIIEGKGFGFVEMATQVDAEKAKKELDGAQFMGRTLKVDEARPQRDKPRGRSGGGGGGGRRY
jgi:RNA recognition motif-containing protein